MRRVTSLNPWTKVTDTDDRGNNKISLLIEASDDLQIITSLRPRGLWHKVSVITFSLLVLYSVLNTIMLVALGLDSGAWVVICGDWSILTVLTWMTFTAEEEILVTESGLSMRILPLARWNRYPIRGIHGLELSEHHRAAKAPRYWRPAMSFHYGSRHVLFGRGLDADTAERVLNLLREKLQLPEEPKTPPLHSSNTPIPKDPITPEVNLDQS